MARRSYEFYLYQFCYASHRQEGILTLTCMKTYMLLAHSCQNVADSWNRAYNNQIRFSGFSTNNSAALTPNKGVLFKKMASNKSVSQRFCPSCICPLRGAFKSKPGLRSSFTSILIFSSKPYQKFSYFVLMNKSILS